MADRAIVVFILSHDDNSKENDREVLLLIENLNIFFKGTIRFEFNLEGINQTSKDFNLYTSYNGLRSIVDYNQKVLIKKSQTSTAIIPYWQVNSIPETSYYMRVSYTYRKINNCVTLVYPIASNAWKFLQLFFCELPSAIVIRGQPRIYSKIFRDIKIDVNTATIKRNR